MSWRRKDNDKYNRSEEVQYWMTIVEEQVYWSCPWLHDWDDFDEYGAWGISWWDYPGGGYVENMDQYHQMKMLTLLRKFNVKSAIAEAKERGW